MLLGNSIFSAGYVPVDQLLEVPCSCIKKITKYLAVVLSKNKIVFYLAFCWDQQIRLAARFELPCSQANTEE